MMNQQTNLTVRIIRCFLLFILAFGLSRLTVGAVMAGPSRILVINTELPGKANGDPLRIYRALHNAGARQTRIIVWTDLTDNFLKSYKPSAIVLSGQGTPWSDYNQKDLTRLCGVLRRTQCLILGICGGHQLLAIAFGGKVSLIHRLRPGPGYEGCAREQGWLPVKIIAPDSIFAGSTQAIVWLNHCDEVKILPEHFEQEVSDGSAANQAIKHKTRPIFGVQFHPEISNAQHPYGEQLLHRFLALAAN